MVNYKAVPVASDDTIIGPEDLLHDSVYPNVSASTSASANTFGSWVEISSDIGTGKRMTGILIGITNNFPASQVVEVEISEGASSSEVAVDRVQLNGTAKHDLLFIPLNRFLTDNARIAVRVRGAEAAVNAINIALQVG